MTKSLLVVAGLVVMVVLIVALDVSFFRNYFWPRLILNVGIVLVFAALYMRFWR